MGPTTFKFVALDAVGSSQKRHQTRRACEKCRRRKKACLHNEGPASSRSLRNSDKDPSPTRSASVRYVDQHQIDQNHVEDVRSGYVDPHDPGEQSVPSLTTDTHDETPVQAQTDSPRQVSKQDHNSRFIGDLSPEAILLAATSPDAIRGSIGIWLSGDASNNATRSNTLSPSNLFYGTGSLIQQILVPLIQQQCLSAVPSPARVKALTKIYFEKVYPILPMINEAAYTELDVLDPHRVILQQSICLAASKNRAARQHLIFDEAEAPVSCRDFGERLSGAMRMSIEMELVTNKTVIIQALTIMSQFTDSPVGEGLSTLFCSRAVHHVQHLGLHLKEGQDATSITILCCVWAVDKLNAALFGRPVMIHERDVSLDLPAYFLAQEPCFRLFLHVIALLDKVIDIYRPASSENPMLTWDFPSFEDVVLQCGMPSNGASTLTSIEILYHAVAILSCRSKTWADPQRSSASYLRQSLSTSILSSIVKTELQDQPPALFPFIPYAMSLSMSMAYREMRHSKLALHRTRSRWHFQTLCDALARLEDVFWSASTTSELGKKLLREMDRVYSTVSTSDRRADHSSGQPSKDQQEMLEAPSRNEGHIAMNTSPDLANQELQEINPVVFDSMPDIDLFGMFDPAFDLDGFDACLEGNLNPAFPTNFQ